MSHGLSWAPLAGGADAVVTTRWKAQGAGERGIDTRLLRPARRRWRLASDRRGGDHDAHDPRRPNTSLFLGGAAGLRKVGHLDRAAELVKTIGTALGAVSLLAYGCGYLALRARAFALGTDPNFLLFDQVYVFAGVRFLAITLIIAVLLAPAFIILRWIAIRLIRALPAINTRADPVDRPGRSRDRDARVVGDPATADGALLRDAAPPAAELSGPDTLADRARQRRARWVGRLAARPRLRLGAARRAFRALARRPAAVGRGDTRPRPRGRGGAARSSCCRSITARCFADRHVRVLGEMPEAVRGLVMPIAVVDRTAAQATLFGRDGAGRPRSTTVALSDLDGVPVEAVMPLEDFVRPTSAGCPDGSRRRCEAGLVLVADAEDASHGPVATSEAGDAGSRASTDRSGNTSAW